MEFVATKEQQYESLSTLTRGANMDIEDEPQPGVIRIAAAEGTAEVTREVAKLALISAGGLLLSGPVAAALVPLGAAYGVRFFESVLKANQQALADALRGEQLRDLADVAAETQANFAKLKDAGHAVSDGDVTGVFTKWSQAWMAADPKLRRALKHAFAAAFDVELYESGMVTDLFRVIETAHLTYGDLRLLAIAARDEKTTADKLVPEDGLSADCSQSPIELWDHHSRKLCGAGLARESTQETVQTEPGSYRGVRRIMPTMLGRKLSQLLSEAKLAQELGQLGDA